MRLRNIKGGSEVERVLGDSDRLDFTEIRILSIETYYEEDREQFEKMVTIVLRGPKGQVEYRFGGVQDFQLRTLEKLKGFEVMDIRERQLEGRKFFFWDPIGELISGYCEVAEVAVCTNQFV